MNEKLITRVALFEGKKIRKVWHDNKWWFVILDVIAALTNSVQPDGYLKDMRRRDNELSKGWGQIATPLLVPTEGGQQKMNCANTEGILRIIQSIPSPKAEPFKLWLARVGYERIQEIENPELATKRTREIYKAKGYSGAWIEKRMRGIEIRATLTDAWKKHGVNEAKEYEILTAEISKAAFGVTPSEYKKIKGLKRENLRDHMNDLELIFSMLGEAATTEITNVEHPAGFHENKKVSKRGGNVAKEALIRLEKETGKKVVSKENYLVSKIAKNKALENKC
ncbi:MAG: Bro-N domain-containing protein [bacterium]